jgi:glucokinase
MTYAIGIDLGGTRLKAVALSATGDVLDRRIEPSNDGPRKVVEVVAAIQRQRGTPAQHIGLAAPGIAAPDGRVVWWMQGRLDAIQGFEWSTLLPNFRGVINDGQAALMGEIAVGVAKGCDNVVMLTLGTGVGGAVVCDGRLLRGAIGRAGHLGHITVDYSGGGDIVRTPGSLEDAIGNCTIAQRTGGRFASTSDLLDAVKAGDEPARKIWLLSVRKLAAAIVSIINAVDPELIVIGGGIAEAGDLLFQPLEQFVRAMEWQPHGHTVRITRATAGEFTGAIGAAHHALFSDGPKGRVENTK